MTIRGLSSRARRIGAVLVVLALTWSGTVDFSASRAAGDSQDGEPTVTHAAASGESPPLSSIARRSAEPEGEPFAVEHPPPGRGPLEPQSGDVETTDGAPLHPVAPVESPLMPVPITSFDGLSQADNFTATNGGNNVPPDTVGDVGPNHYVQQTNVSVKVFSKTGTVLLGPISFRAMFASFAPTDPCRTNAGGDPIVLYDPLADRWMLTSFTGSTVNNICMAYSQTSDPTGAYNLYRFAHPFAGKFNDYPKFGIWPDGIYMSTNQFTGSTFTGVSVHVFDRAAIIAGAANPTQIAFDLSDGLPPDDANSFTLLPSDVDGPAPPGGATNTFVGFRGSSLDVWEFHADFATPSNSTFTGPTFLSVGATDFTLCNFGPCVPQKDTSTLLDTVSPRLMQRNAYRNFPDRRSMVLSHTVDANSTDVAGVRWYELRNTTGAWSIFQQGTLESANDGGTADGVHRWMSSAAMDQAGNIGVGYSASSSTLFPSVRYTGRVPGDPPGTLPQGEASIIEGGGAQADATQFSNPASARRRWGDYSAMSIDPSDDCTFWYTTEYYSATSTTAQWKTRIGSFKFPSCNPPATSTLNVSDASINEGSTGNVVVTASPAPTSNITFTAATGGGNATAGADYTSVNGTFTINANTTSVNVPINTLQDSTDEPNETFNVTISNPSANAVVGDGTGVVTIVDDDNPSLTSTLNVADAAQVTEGNQLSFSVSASPTNPLPITFTAQTSDGSASAPSDYTAVNQQFTIPANTSSVTVPVTTNDDGVDEPDTENLFLNISSPSPNATIGDGQGTGTIADNDESPLLTETLTVFGKGSIVVDGGGACTSSTKAGAVCEVVDIPSGTILSLEAAKVSRRWKFKFWGGDCAPLGKFPFCDLEINADGETSALFKKK